MVPTAVARACGRERLQCCLMLAIGLVLGYLHGRCPLTRPDERPTKQTIPTENGTLAERLYREVKVLCWIMTTPVNHRLKAVHVKRTWGSRCNKLLFMSSARNQQLDTVALPVLEGRDNLWAKTKQAFRYIYEHHLQDADWFVKADDDTFMVMENLRYLLYPYSPEFPVYFGCRFKKNIKQGYMSGGAGYVLSKEAVRRLVEQGLPDVRCRQDGAGQEDVELGRCLELVQVRAGDSRDPKGRGRFFPFEPQNHMFRVNVLDWYWKWIYYPTEEGMNCCSEYAISFHYVSPEHMYVMTYLIYGMRPYGIVQPFDALPRKVTWTELLDQISTTTTDFTTPQTASAIHKLNCTDVDNHKCVGKLED